MMVNNPPKDTDNTSIGSIDDLTGYEGANMTSGEDLYGINRVASRSEESLEKQVNDAIQQDTTKPYRITFHGEYIYDKGKGHNTKWWTNSSRGYL